jgi:NAD-dependent dihydropyrimidine dehydrogenase PreA subunit
MNVGDAAELEGPLMDGEGQISIDQDICTGCGRCVLICPTDVLSLSPDGKAYARYEDDCCVCMLCVTDCPVKCIDVDFRVHRNFVSVYDHLQIDVSIPLRE